MIVRYADDFVMGFESKADAREMLLALKARLASFGLTLHEDKTLLICRFAALSRQRRGERRPETFASSASPTTAGGPGMAGSS